MASERKKKEKNKECGVSVSRILSQSFKNDKVFNVGRTYGTGIKQVRTVCYITKNIEICIYCCRLRNETVNWH
jgi:hypothetical protein